MCSFLDFKATPICFLLPAAGAGDLNETRVATQTPCDLCMFWLLYFALKNRIAYNKLPFLGLFHEDLFAERAAHRLRRHFTLCTRGLVVVKSITVGSDGTAIYGATNFQPLLGSNLLLVVHTPLKRESAEKTRVLGMPVPDFPRGITGDVLPVQAAAVLPRDQAVAADGLHVAEDGLARGIRHDNDPIISRVVRVHVHVDAAQLVALLQLHLQGPVALQVPRLVRDNLTTLTHNIDARVESETMPVRSGHKHHFCLGVVTGSHLAFYADMLRK